MDILTYLALPEQDIFVAFGNIRRESRNGKILRRENPEEQRDGEAGRCETIPGNADEMRNAIIGSSAN